jgi:hypothetical protein
LPEALTWLDEVSTTVPPGFLVVRTTAVLVRGTLSGGPVTVTVPAMLTLLTPENEVPFVVDTVTAAAAKAAVGANTKKAARRTVARVGSVFISFTVWLDRHRDVAGCRDCYSTCVGHEYGYRVCTGW